MSKIEKRTAENSLTPFNPLDDLPDDPATPKASWSSSDLVPERIQHDPREQLISAVGVLRINALRADGLTGLERTILQAIADSVSAFAQTGKVGLPHIKRASREPLASVVTSIDVAIERDGEELDVEQLMALLKDRFPGHTYLTRTFADGTTMARMFSGDFRPFKRGTWDGYRVTAEGKSAREAFAALYGKAVAGQFERKR